MVQHTIFGSTAPAAVQNSDTSQINLATAFYITSGSTWTATGIRVYIDPASNAPLVGYHGYLSSGANAQALTLLQSTTFSVTKSGWNEFGFGSAVPLAVGTKYWATVYFPGGCYSATSHAFDTARQASDGSALYAAGNSEVSPGNGAYDYGGPGTMSGAGSYNATWYGVDVITDDGTVLPPTGQRNSLWLAYRPTRGWAPPTQPARRWGGHPPRRSWQAGAPQ